MGKFCSKVKSTLCVKDTTDEEYVYVPYYTDEPNAYSGQGQGQAAFPQQAPVPFVMASAGSPSPQQGAVGTIPPPGYSPASPSGPAAVVAAAAPAKPLQANVQSGSAPQAVQVMPMVMKPAPSPKAVAQSPPPPQQLPLSPQPGQQQQPAAGQQGKVVPVIGVPVPRPRMATRRQENQENAGLQSSAERTAGQEEEEHTYRSRTSGRGLSSSCPTSYQPACMEWMRTSDPIAGCLNKALSGSSGSSYASSSYND